MSQPRAMELPDEIVGKRVLLRPYREEDADALWDAVDESRAHLAPWMPWVDDYRSAADARIFARAARARWLLREDLAVGIFENGNGRLVGGSGLHRIDWVARSFEIGYWVRMTAEGRGFVSETASLLTRLAFDTLDARRVEIRIDPRNARSRAVAERCGYVLEGQLRDVVLGADGQPADRLVFGLTRADYQSLG